MTKWHGPVIAAVTLAGAAGGWVVGNTIGGNLRPAVQAMKPIPIWKSAGAAWQSDPLNQPDCSGLFREVAQSDGWQVGQKDQGKVFLTWRLERRDPKGHPYIYTSVCEWDGRIYTSPKFGQMVRLIRHGGQFGGWAPCTRGGTDALDDQVRNEYVAYLQRHAPGPSPVPNPIPIPMPGPPPTPSMPVIP